MVKLTVGHPGAEALRRDVCIVCKTLFNHTSLRQLSTTGFHKGRHYYKILYKIRLFTNDDITYKK